MLFNIKPEQFAILSNECEASVTLVFEELASDKDNYETACQLIGELVITCKRMKDYNFVKYLKQNLVQLIPKVEK